MSTDPERIQTPKTLKYFARTLGRHLPARMMQLRNIGKLTRAKATPRGRR